jgi:phage terminase small subunit
MALTKMQSAFIREYLLDENRDGTQAAIRAGYSEDRAKREAKELLERPDIQDAITSAVREFLQPFRATPQGVLDGLIYNVRACRANGNDLYSLAECRKSFELIGRHLGMFSEKLTLDVSDKVIALLNSRRQKLAEKPEPETIPAMVVPELSETAGTKPLTRRQFRRETKRQEQDASVQAWQSLTQAQNKLN